MDPATIRIFIPVSQKFQVLKKEFLIKLSKTSHFEELKKNLKNTGMRAALPRVLKIWEIPNQLGRFRIFFFFFSNHLQLEISMAKVTKLDEVLVAR